MSSSKHGTILIVDDDDQLVRMLHLVLTARGYHCVTAYGGCQAITRLKQEQVDLVITDLSMMWGDGLALLQWIRRDSDRPVIVVSGHMQEFAAQVNAFKNVTVVPKPIEMPALLDAVRRLCRPAKAGSPVEGKSMKGRSVVVADDDPGIVHLLKTVLKPMKLEVHAAPDAFSALVRIRELPPDIAILDINMPAGNGLSVCEMLFTDKSLPRMPVIILTGEPDSTATQRCAALGAHLVIKGAEAMKQVVGLVKDLLEAPPAANESQFFIG